MTSNPNEINTVLENAEEGRALMNKYLAEAGAKDSKGNPAVVQHLAGSPLWLFALARGQQATEWQERAKVVYEALDIQSCEDDQVKNLALLSGLKQKQRTATYMLVYISNDTDQTITINSRNSIFHDTVYNYDWYIGQNLTLAVHTDARVPVYCATTNEVSLKAGTTFNVTPIATSWSDFVCSAVSGTIEGSSAETIAELRNRVMVGTSAYSAINKAQDAIARLKGVAKCSIYFNRSATNVMPLEGGISVPARQALVVIRGADADELLARTYFDYMDVQSYNPGQDYNVLTSYTRIGALDMPVHYLQATAQKVYVKVSVNIKASDPNYSGYIKDVLTAHSGTTEVGQNLTTKLVSVWLNDVADYVDVIDVEISDDGITWGNSSAIDCYKYAEIDLDNVSYVPV